MVVCCSGVSAAASRCSAAISATCGPRDRGMVEVCCSSTREICFRARSNRTSTKALRWSAPTTGSVTPRPRSATTSSTMVRSDPSQRPRRRRTIHAARSKHAPPKHGFRCWPPTSSTSPTGQPVAWPNVRPSTMVTVAGVKVGIVGVTTTSTPVTTIAENLRGLTFAPLAPAIEREASQLRASGASAVVVVAHAGGRCGTFDTPADTQLMRRDVRDHERRPRPAARAGRRDRGGAHASGHGEPGKRNRRGRGLFRRPDVFAGRSHGQSRERDHCR